jgi:betaine reductase
MTAVHYLNQFFAGLGGEEAADHEPVRLEGPQGPGRGLAAAGLVVNLTLACGDDHFGEHEPEALATLLAWLEEADPDVLVCGPSFGSGRYGYACGVLAREAGRRGIPVVSAMEPDSPGVLAAVGAAYIVPTGSNVAGMREALPIVASLASRLAAGESVGGPEQEGYLPRGLRVNALADRSGAERAVDLLLAKLAGTVRTEVEPRGDLVPPPPPVDDLASVRLALVTEAGCVPQGNPDRLPTRHANVWLRYGIADTPTLKAGAYESVHAGFDTSAANADPNRLVPLDAARELELNGSIGAIHEAFYTTSGVDTPVAIAARHGQEIAAELRESQVGAVILTGTCGTGTRCGAVLAKEFEREGIPTVFVTALPTIARMVGANRIVRGVAITNPTGDPSLARDDEHELRVGIVRRALDMLATEVEPHTVWEVTA